MLLFGFNNKVIVVELPDNEADVDRVEDLNPNYLARIDIDRECQTLFSLHKYIILISLLTTTINIPNNMIENITATATISYDIEDEVGKGKILILDITNRTTKNYFTDDKYETSDIILLELISMDIEYTRILEWKESHHVVMDKHRRPIFASNSKHHSLTEKFCSHGNKANSEMVGLSFVAQYTNRKFNYIVYHRG